MPRILLAIAFVLIAGVASAERRVALVIGADDYKTIRKLDNAVGDAQAVGDMLEDLGFEVFLETNRDLRRTRRALEDFREDGGGADVALVYFAGHGVEIAGDNRLLPTDADASSLDALEDTTLPLEEVRETVAAVAKTGLIMLDACRNDPFGTAPGGAGEAKDMDADRSAVAIPQDVVDKAKPGLGRIGKAEGILFAFSAAPGETASDGADGHSPFAEALIKYLGTDGLEVRSTLTLVQQEVYDKSLGKQLPYVESGLPTLFFAAATDEQLPERERLLLAMADVTPDLRAEVETIAARAEMPLAPLYGTLISANVGSLTPPERSRKLQEAADAFVKVRAEMRALASDDPEVTKLRQQAEQQLSLGAFETARAILASAADIDSNSRQSLKENLIARTISEATTHYLAGGAARADLRYQLAISDYEKAVALYDEISGFDISDDHRYQHALILEFIGAMQTTTGNLPGAGDAYKRMEAVILRHSEKAPGQPRWQRDLAIAKGMVADVLYSQGDLSGALDKYLESRTILNTLIQTYPDDANWVPWVRDLSVNVNRSGDVRRISGDYEAALTDYRNALGLMEILIGIDPTDAGWRFDMAISRQKVGMALRLLGDFKGALAEFDVAITIDEDLAGKEPDNAEYQHHITVNLNWIGDLKRLEGKPAEAFAPYERSRAILEKLIAKDPQNTLYRNDMSVVLGKIGDARQSTGDVDGALEMHGSSLAIAEYLAELDPTNSEWQRSLSVSYNRIGDLEWAKGELDKAVGSYGQSRAIVEKLIAGYPDNTLYRRDLSITLGKIGDARLAKGDLAGALDTYRASVTAAAYLAALDPANPEWQIDLSINHNRLGDALLASKDIAAAATEYEAGYVIAKALLDAAPDKAERILNVAYSRYKLAMAGVDREANLTAARDALAALKAAGTLPPAYEGWIAMVDEASKAGP